LLRYFITGNYNPNNPVYLYEFLRYLLILDLELSRNVNTHTKYASLEQSIVKDSFGSNER